MLSANIGSVRTLALSCDRTTLAIGVDRSVTLWDLEKQRERVQFRCEYDVVSVAFSPDGRTLVAGLYDGSINIWPAATATVVRRAGW